MDYTITGIKKASREVQLTIHFPTGDKPMSYVVPEDVDTLPAARAFVEAKIEDAVMEWKRLQPVAPKAIDTVLDAVVGVRRTIAGL